jgi:hypothetical protein
MSKRSEHDGPFDAAPWPEVITARVVTAGARPRLHGYDCEGDLATGTTCGERVILALTGELPSRAQARAFDVVTSFLAPVAVNEAPTHAAVLARLCSGSTSSIVATAALALAEQARSAVASLAPHWPWLVRAQGDAPADLKASGEDDTASVVRLREALRPSGLVVAALERDLGRGAAVVATLIACGLLEPDQVEAAWVVTRLPVAFAEAMADKPGNLRAYPWHLPPFRYEEGLR